MPTYKVHCIKGSLSTQQKQEIAKGVSDIHSTVTGAQIFFAQVLFHEIEQDSWYLGGEPLAKTQIFLFGYIRAGRTTEQKSRMLRAMRDLLVEKGRIDPEHAWVYIAEVPASQIIEYGDILPEPGGEKEWIENASKAAQALLLSNKTS